MVTVATEGSLLTQVPPLEGDKPVVAPTQILLGPLILTVGNALTVTEEVGADIHPVPESVKVKLAVPADTPVTTPAFVTVATDGSLLTQVPPDAGDKVVVTPTQMLLAPVMLTEGFAFTVTAEVGSDSQPVTLSVNIKVTEPADTPVTMPAFVTVATAGSELTQRPFVGDNVVVPPIQMLLEPVMLTTGSALIVTVGVGKETQPVLVLVKVNVAVPAATAVTTPASVTVATPGLLLAQVPPVVGDKPVVPPMQILVGPRILTLGSALIVTGKVGSDSQPVVEFVKIKVADPALTPVTRPAFVTVAMDGLLLLQVPPVDGDKVVVLPTQTALEPVMLTTGNGSTVTAEVGKDTQPVVVLVYVKVALPDETAVTMPALSTVATALLLLVQVPPVDGDKVVLPPTQTLLDPVTLTVGIAFTVNGVVVFEHPLEVFVKVKEAIPAKTPVTSPALVMVAIKLSLLVQVPPVLGDTLVILPSQILLDPTKLTVGRLTRVTDEVADAVHPSALVTVTV